MLLKEKENSDAFIFSVSISEELNLIFTGDDKGNLRAFDVVEVIETLKKLNSNENMFFNQNSR